MYVCGPTVYDYPHIGNARSNVIYDLLYRTLIYIYGNKHILYVRNITDIDDKIILRAKEKKISISQLTTETTNIFHENMKYLKCLSPNIEPKVTNHINEIIDFIIKLIRKNYAYQINNHVFFDVQKAKNYNILSGRSLKNLLSGNKNDTNPNKKHPADFVLWKPSSEQDNLAKFNSPFGMGRPGWHIECSAISQKYLGPSFDIHGGGIDLIFPHHTNEIAQSTSANPYSLFANTWIHNGVLTINNEKMSKSIGNVITIQDFINKGIQGINVRLFLLSCHYRKPLNYNSKTLNDAYKTIKYWYNTIHSIPTKINYLNKLPVEFMNYILNDLNTAMAISVINNYAKEMNSTNNSSKKYELASKIYSCANFLGINLNKKTIENESTLRQIQDLIEKRAIAKKAKNWELSDKIRIMLNNMGILIEDMPDGSSQWKYKL